MFQGCVRGLFGCLESFQGCDVSIEFEGHLKGISKVLQGCVKVVSGIFS